MATIAELQTKLTVDNTQFKRGMNESTRYVQGLSDKAKSLLTYTAIVAGIGIAFHTLAGIISDTEKRVSALVDTSTRLGAGIPQLQRLQYAAGQTGVSIGSLNKSLGLMGAKLADAARASDIAAKVGATTEDAFTRIGLSAKSLIGLGIDEQYIAIAAALKNITNSDEQLAASKGIFGKGGIEQLSLIKDNVAGLVDEFKGLGLELSTDQARAIESYGDSVTKMGAVWLGFEDQLTAALAGPFKAVLDWIVTSSISMGGLAPIATAVGQSIVTGLSVGLTILQGLSNAVDFVTIAFDALAITAIQTFRIATLGLADLTTGIAATQAKFEKDATDRAKAIGSNSLTFGAQQALESARGAMNAPAVNAQQAQQQTVKVEIQAGDGFIAKVTGSASFQEQLGSGVNNIIQNQAAGVR